MRSTFSYVAVIAALFLMSNPHLGWPQKQLLTTVQALDEDRKGVLADVVRIFGDGREEWLAKTNQKGIASFIPPISCDFNHRIRVRPDAPLRYQQPDYQRCEKTLSFLVKRWGDVKQALVDSPDSKIVESLWEQAETLEDKKNHTGLPLVYTELSTRLEWTKSPLVKQLRDKFAGGRHLHGFIVADNFEDAALFRLFFVDERATFATVRETFEGHQVQSSGHGFGVVTSGAICREQRTNFLFKKFNLLRSGSLRIFAVSLH